MTIKTILVDDEPKAIAILKNKLERFCPNIEVIATTQSPQEAITVLQSLKPDLVFMDVSMPEISGFEVLKQISDPDFEIIFATAFSDYAIDAIKHCAIGYLVKPIDNDDLIDAVKIAVKNIQDKSALKKNQLLIENLSVQKFQDKCIVIPSTDGLEFIKIKDIIHCEGVDGYTKVYLNDKTSLLSSNSIGHFNKMLSKNNFYLIHKSHLINLDFLKKYLNEGYVILSNNTKIPVSRNRKADFVNSLKNN